MVSVLTMGIEECGLSFPPQELMTFIQTMQMRYKIMFLIKKALGKIKCLNLQRYKTSHNV